MLLLFTTCHSVTTGSRSNLHRSVLYFFTFTHLFSDTFKMSLKKKLNLCGPILATGLQRQYTQSSCKLNSSPAGRQYEDLLVLPIIWRQNRDPLFKLLAADRIRLNNDVVTLYSAIACVLVMTLTKKDTDTGRVDYKYLEQWHDRFDISGYN